MAEKRKALITGITGQDGSYLAELLLEKGYEVHGIVRRSSSLNTGRIDHIFSSLQLHYGDLTDSSSLHSILSKIRPDEVYNLAAQSHVMVSFQMAEYTSDVDALGTLRLLEAIRSAGLTKTTRLYQASTSEMFGQVIETPQTELTPFNPQSPYGCAKVFAHMLVKNFRDSYGMFAVCGILFNHESPRRGRTFVTRKITTAVANITAGRQECVTLGNLNALRDWGHAKDYVEAMWMMLQADEPRDLVVATNEQHSVKKFCDASFAFAGIKLRWEGAGLEEVGKGPDGRVYVRVDERYFRPSEVETLLGDATRAHTSLGWKPRTTFHELVYDMLVTDFDERGQKLDSFETCLGKLAAAP